jgi:hypothetical protein
MSGKFKVPIQLVDATKDDTVTILAADDHLLLRTTEGEEHAVLDDRTVLGSMASQDADSVTITGGTISGITPIAVADGGTGADTAAGALDNLGAVPTSRTVNNKSLASNITLSNSDIGSEPAITAGTTAQFWQGNKSWQNFGDSVRATLLTGLSTSTKSAIVATDTTIVALGKLQAQVSAELLNPMTTAGDIIVGGTNGAPTRLAVGSSGQVITSNGTSLAWADNSPYSLPLAVADGGTGADTATGALASTTSYGASLEADGEDISLIDQNGTTLATVQTQDISGKLDKQAIYSSAGVTSTFFHEEDGGGYRLADNNDDSLSFIGGNADTDSPIKIETYAKTVADNVGTRIIQTLEKIYYTAGKSSATYGNGDEVAVKSNIPTALSSLTNDGNYVVDASYVHTDNNFTTGEKTKLAGLDDNHFKGSYPSLTALETAHPTASDGDYAYVGTEGTPAVMYLWDVTDSEWVLGGSPAGETPASAKEKYESNEDTNAYTDDEKAIVGSVGDVADLETSAKTTIVAAVNEVVGTFDDYVPTSRTVNGKALSSNIMLANSDIGSEPAITAGTTAQFWQGDKSWQDFGSSVRATLLTGLSTATKSAIAATDTTIVALGKLQAQISASFANPMTAVGDIIVGGTNGTPTRLPVGSSGQVITSNGTSLAWADSSSYSLPIATTTTLGGIKPDGTSITVNASTGVAPAVGGGGGSDSWVPSSQYIDITYGAGGTPTLLQLMVGCTSNVRPSTPMLIS